MPILIILFILSKDKIKCPYSLIINRRQPNNIEGLAKSLNDQCVRMNIKQKVKPKIQQLNIDISSNQTVRISRFFASVYSNEDNKWNKYKSKIYYLATGIIKNSNVNINGKQFYDESIDPDVKWWK